MCYQYIFWEIREGLVLELGILSQEIQPEEIPYKFNCATYNLQMWKGLSCYKNEPDFIRNVCVGSRCMA